MPKSFVSSFWSLENFFLSLCSSFFGFITPCIAIIYTYNRKKYPQINKLENTIRTRDKSNTKKKTLYDYNKTSNKSSLVHKNVSLPEGVNKPQLCLKGLTWLTWLEGKPEHPLCSWTQSFPELGLQAGSPSAKHSGHCPHSLHYLATRRENLLKANVFQKKFPYISETITCHMLTNIYTQQRMFFPLPCTLFCVILYVVLRLRMAAETVRRLSTFFPNSSSLQHNHCS